MKKYVKPDLIYEQYELTQHIAADCAFNMQLGNQYACVAVGNEDYFGCKIDDVAFTDSSRCTLVDSEMFCYQNSTDGMYPIFGS